MSFSLPSPRVTQSSPPSTTGAANLRTAKASPHSGAGRFDDLMDAVVTNRPEPKAADKKAEPEKVPGAPANNDAQPVESSQQPAAAQDQAAQDQAASDQTSTAQGDSQTATAADPNATQANPADTAAAGTTAPDAAAAAQVASLLAAANTKDQTASPLVPQDQSAQTPSASQVPPQPGAAALKSADDAKATKDDGKGVAKDAGLSPDASFAKLLDQAKADPHAQAPAKSAAAATDASQPLAEVTTDAPRTDTTSAFSLQPAAPADPSSTYSTATASPAASNMSQAAIQNLSAMAVEIQHRLSAGNSRFAMELHPADLGRVEVALTIGANGAATAHLKFDSAVTAAAFSAHESELRQSLTQAGVTLSDDALSFSSGDGASSNGNAFASQQDSQNASAFAARRMRAAAELEAQSDTAALDTRLDTSLAAFRKGASRLALNLIV